ncbi:hypothetical protein DUNSADRAFT_14613 [Dunaliella salina]|uniref:Pyroglutamyl-peptidase I n=1 Tax=Dunaliella salina TaxID=3046 RepID=A0ABQ7H2H8_DUNSA|nr:hypothetical protein DUNSADRAFT_14613 [Dunaliella salina]|eukprot:KAF5841055.1 hypothetical protein DUNSADRAFT_14613 [Dunaliella salina]
MTPCVKVIITGFGPFAGVQDNPTQHLCKWLASEPSVPLRCNVEIIHAETLCVAAQDVDEWTQNRLCPILEEESGPGCKILVLHLGVHGSASCIHLERCAANMADFRSPDQRGCQLLEPIEGSLMQGSTRSTGLDLEVAASKLSCMGHQVQLSCNAGCFLCNWVYFRSLGLCKHSCEVPSQDQTEELDGHEQRHNPIPLQQGHGMTHMNSICAAKYNSQPASQSLCRYSSALRSRNADLHSLFVHVPPFTAVPEHAQRQCLQDLLLVLSGMLTGRS